MAAAVAAASALGAAPGAASVQPYGANDAGGFSNVLPAGQRGTDNAAELALFQSTGETPEHWLDQQPLYDRLIQASPTLTNTDIRRYSLITSGVEAPESMPFQNRPTFQQTVSVTRDIP